MLDGARGAMGRLQKRSVMTAHPTTPSAPSSADRTPPHRERSVPADSPSASAARATASNPAGRSPRGVRTSCSASEDRNERTSTSSRQLSTSTVSWWPQARTQRQRRERRDCACCRGSSLPLSFRQKVAGNLKDRSLVNLPLHPPLTPVDTALHDIGLVVTGSDFDLHLGPLPETITELRG